MLSKDEKTEPKFLNISSETKQEFESIELHIKQLLQEVSFLVETTQTDKEFALENQKVMEHAMSTLSNCKICSEQFPSFQFQLEAQAKELNSLIQKTLKNSTSAQFETQYIYSEGSEFLNSQLQSFKTKCEKAADKLGLNLHWSEGNQPPDSYFKVSIEFSDSISSKPCKETIDEMEPCNGYSTKFSLCSYKHYHLESLFAFNCQILANFNNFLKVILYLKIQLESSLRYLETITEQSYYKHKIYKQAKGSTYMKTKVLSSESFAEMLEQMLLLGKSLKCENKKLYSFIKLLPKQLKTSQETCMFISDFFSSGTPNYSHLERVKQIYTLTKQVASCLLYLCDQFESSVSSEESKELFLKHVSDVAENRLYRALHMKSSLLKDSQPQKVISELNLCRNQLLFYIKEFAKLKNYHKWEEIANKLSVASFRIPEGKVRHSNSINKAGFHSYNSSWGANTQVSESFEKVQLDSSEVSEKELSWSTEDQKLDFQKTKKIIISDKFLDLATYDSLLNSLKSEVKEIHSQGLKGWKKQLKLLKKHEKEQSALNELEIHTKPSGSIKSVYPRSSTKVLLKSSTNSSRKELSRSKTPNYLWKPSLGSVIEGPRQNLYQELGKLESDLNSVIEPQSTNLSPLKAKGLEGQLIKHTGFRKQLCSKAKTFNTPLSSRRVTQIQNDRSLSPIEQVRKLRTEFENQEKLIAAKVQKNTCKFRSSGKIISLNSKK